MLSVPRRDVTRARELTRLGQLSLFSDREGVVHTICLSGELDLATVTNVEEELLRVEATDASAIVVDLSGLSFRDSTGIRLLVQRSNAPAQTPVVCSCCAPTAASSAS